jgi:hypothetical protein
MAQTLDGEAGHSNVVHDFTWEWVSESGNSAAQEFGMLNTAAGDSLCGVSMDLSDHTLNVNAPVKFGSIGSDSPVTTANTLYYIRERISDNGDCTFDCFVFVDETPNWGAGAWYTGSIIGEDYPSSGACTAVDTDIRGVSFPGSTGSRFDYVVDDSGLCDEVVTGTIPVGTKCGGAGVNVYGDVHGYIHTDFDVYGHVYADCDGDADRDANRYAGRGDVDRGRRERQ